MRRNEWLLGGGLVVMMALVGMALLFFWLPNAQRSGQESAIATQVARIPTTPGQTAVIAFGTAQRAALAWQPDAQLLRATATWLPVQEPRALRDGAGQWAFTFYSSATGLVGDISVVGGETTAVTERRVDQPLTPLQVGGWRIDSDEAVDLLLANGGADFIRQEGVTTLSMNLMTDTAENRITWLMALFANRTRQSLTLRLDANTGEIFDGQETP